MQPKVIVPDVDLDNEFLEVELEPRSENILAPNGNHHPSVDPT
ncbi:hypothetical protein [Actinomyces minihominis]|nr:hypothetical protein [Actinomyces minihominis]